jgi:hypothetical protein
VGLSIELSDFASDRLLPLLAQFCDVQIAKATSPLKVEISWLKARIVVLETAAMRQQKQAA